MDDGYSPASIVLFLAFLILSAVFYGFESAVENLNIPKLEEESEEGDSQKKKLLEIAEQPKRFLNTFHLAVYAVGMAAGFCILGQTASAAAWMLERRFSFSMTWLMPVCVVVTGLVLLVVLMILGVIVPRKLAAREPEKWGLRLLTPVKALMKVCLPITAVMEGISVLLLKAAGIDINASDDNVTEEEIMSMVNEGHEQGVLEADEAEMITNIFEMGDKTAEDVMTHRKNIVALDCTVPLREALQFILKEGNNSRYPVYREDVDDIIGILHMRDAVLFFERPEYRDKSLEEIPQLLREAHFIPETRNLDTLFKEMQSKKIHLEIVVDEYGQTAGLVTMEDILEEIVGNILDEYDVDEDFIVAQEDGSFILSGMAPLDEVSDVLGIEFDEEDEELYDTINGFLISKLGRIPAEGEKPEVDCLGYKFQILKVGNKMIQSVRAVRMDQKPESEEEDSSEEA